jgi:hypothetical protein
MIASRNQNTEINHGIVHNDFSVIAHQRRLRTQESQIGLTVKPNARQQKKISGRVWYQANREEKIRRSTENNRRNPERAKEMRRRRKLKLGSKLLNQRLNTWQKNHREKCAEYARRYRAKVTSMMTADEIKARNRNAYQQTRARMIELYGLDGWRRLCADRCKISREKARQKLLTQAE